ncbi:MAG: hypothetical protein HY902_20765 [Deltaproteobacteria bacterium]|nr:hypothetical protein [Deltaproteobacteria bacterium]
MLKLHSIRLALAAGLILSAGTAHALTYCDDKNPCPSGKECFVAVCVPSTSVCTADANCKSYQSCDFSCKVSGSGTVGTTTPVEADAGLVAADGGSSGGGSGSGSSGGEADKRAPDAGSSSVDATAIPQPEDVYTPPPVPECPKSKGVCIADQKKVQPQPGCTEFCKTMATCGGLGGSSSGGSSGSGGGSVPPETDASSPGFVPPDAGSSDFAWQDAGEAQPIDAGAYVDAQPMDMNIESPDVSVEVGQAQIDMCIQLCSVIKLGGYLPKEWGAMEQCVLDNIGKCEEVNSKCEALSEPVGKAFDGNEHLAIDLLGLNFGGGMSSGGNSTEGGGKGSNDADAATTGAPRYQGDASGGADVAAVNPDAAGSSDAKTSAAASSSSSASSSGCTSGSTGGSLGGLAGLLGLCSALVLRRKYS